MRCNNQTSENFKEDKKVIKDELIYSIDDETYSAHIIDYQSSTIDVFIPRSIEYNNHEYIVTSINKNSFEFSFRLKSIQFPLDSELRKIETNSFYNSTLERITIPSSVCELQYGWCHGAVQLKKVNLMPNNKMFMHIDNKIIIGKKDIKSKEYDTLLYIQPNIKRIVIPSFIKEISPYVFSSTEIESISIPPQITKICKFAFSNCRKLQFVEFLGNSKLEIIEEFAFAHSKIKNICFPSSVLQICESSFTNCEYLTKIDFHRDSKIQIIEKNAFSWCTLFCICIPKSITKIGEEAFFINNLLVLVEFDENSNIQSIDKNIFNYSEKANIMIPVKLRDRFF